MMTMIGSYSHSLSLILLGHRWSPRQSLQINFLEIKNMDLGKLHSIDSHCKHELVNLGRLWVRQLEMTMAKAVLKTQKTEASVDDFLSAIPDAEKRADSFAIVELMQKVSKEKPKMWGPAIVGFGVRQLKYDSGREMEWMKIGFSPRKSNLTMYIGAGEGKHEDLKAKLGKYTTGKGCLYVKRLADIDQKVLKELIAASLKSIE